MATIGSLAVNIVASTDKFISGLNKAQTGLGRFVSKISAAQTAVVGLGVYGFARMVTSAVNAGSELHDLSKKLGISTEAISALDFATKQLGGSTSAMHTALQFMSKTLGQAAQGATAAQAAFERLGINFRDLLNIPVEQQFLSLVDAINKLPTAAERAAAAQQVFGRGGKELAAIIAAGTAEIVKFGDEAARAGAIVSTDSAAALDEAADAATAFKDSWSAMWTQGVGLFAPLISGAFKVLGFALKVFRVTFMEMVDQILAGVGLMIRAWETLASAANYLLPKAFEFDAGKIDAWVKGFEEARQGIAQQQDIIIRGGKGAGPLKVPPAQAAAAAGQVKEQKTTNQKLDQVVAAVQAGQGKVQLATAGVR